MKAIRSIWWIAVLTVLTACEKGEPQNPAIDGAKRILFDMPILSVESRSTFKNALTEGDEFGVMGYCVPYQVGTEQFNYSAGKDIWALKKAFCPPEVFNSQKITVSTDGCVYDWTNGTDNNPKYWYRDGYDTENVEQSAITQTDDYRYSFIAWYPYDAFRADWPDGKEIGTPKLTFTMPQTGTSSNSLLTHADTPDAMLAVLYNHTKKDGNIRFNFNHVLTGLGFEVNNFSNYDLTVHSISLSGSFYKDVTIDLTGENVTFSFSDNRYTGTYALLTSDLKLQAPEAGEVNSSGLIGGEHLLLISGTGNSFGENVVVSINYTFNGQPGQQSLPRPGTFTPRPGIKYTAQLNFVGDTFVLQFIVDNEEQWEDGKSDNDDIVFE